MALYVYITEECKGDATRHNRHEEMNRLKDKVEKAQRMCHFDNFPPPYLKKRFDRQIRLLADYRTVSVQGEEHIVICFLRTYVRSSKEYEQFLRDTTRFGQQFLSPLVSEEMLVNFLGERLKKNTLPPKVPPSELEHHFLYRLLGSDSNRTTEEFVCESERWVQATGNNRIRDRLYSICQELRKIVDNKPTHTSYPILDYYVSYRWFPLLNKHFLAGVARSQTEAEEIGNLYADILSVDDRGVTEEELLRNSARAYPVELFADEDAWMDIQKDVEANLALSREETAVLESVHHNDGGYPIFINGRAGSGKSTILYYLFADYVNLYIELKANHPSLLPPLLLSCSHDLRRQAEKTVGNLIRCNPRWHGTEQQSPEVPTECFKEFRTFLRDLVPAEVRNLKFEESAYVDYARFRHIWEAQFQSNRSVRKIGPDLSWHVIRTYIKGSNAEDYLEPEEYEHLPRKQKSVSQASFKAVYEYVWEGWYRPICEQDGYWDDQDLARQVFESGSLSSEYPAVFCDEAQDFTRVELDLLFSLCLFANRRLGHEDIRRVPIAFAGDPFQTINPTGFRWDSIQALYHDKLVDTLGENLYSQIDLNYRDLNLNYRSTKNIVRLCNLIQAFRAALFDISTLRPQESWQREEASPMPVWFDRNTPNAWSQLKNEKDITIIVPCALNEEQNFVKNDPRLTEVVQLDELGTPVNVLSPARAKGLEFARVVLYNFAQHAPGSLLDLLDKKDIDQDQLLPYEYFVNQLYVAASRPKRRLFIIEDQKGRDELWRIALDEPLQQKLWARIPHGAAIWASQIGGFEIGTAESWSEDRGDVEENARQFAQQGMSNRDPFLLRSAAVSYDNLGKCALAERYRASAFRFERRYLEAGDHFQKASEFLQALECFWAFDPVAKDRILALHTAFPDIATRVEYRLVEVLDNPTSQTMLAATVNLLEDSQRDDKLKHRLRTEKAFEQIISSFAKQLLGENKTADLMCFLRDLDALKTTGLPVQANLFAELHFAVGEYNQAVHFWELGENFSVLPKYKEAKEIVLAEMFESNPDATLSPSDYHILAAHFQRTRNYLLVAKCLEKSGTTTELIALLADLPEDFDAKQNLVTDIVEELIKRDEWDGIASIALMSINGGDARNPRTHASKLGAIAPEIRNAVIISCGSSETFAKQSASVLRRYSEYFKKSILESAQWRELLTPEIVGAAIERAGRQVDALQFYEQVMNGTFARKHKEFAAKRWIITKEKQAKRESEGGNEKAASRYQREASDRRKEHGLLDVEMPEFPDVDMKWVESQSRPVEPTAKAPLLTATNNHHGKRVAENLIVTEKQSGIAFDIGEFRFEFINAQRRVNITHLQSFNTANIRAEGRLVRSSDIEVRVDDGLYTCVPWNSECQFLENDRELRAIFHLRDYGLSLGFTFISAAEG